MCYNSYLHCLLHGSNRLCALDCNREAYCVNPKYLCTELPLGELTGSTEGYHIIDPTAEKIPWQISAAVHADFPVIDKEFITHTMKLLIQSGSKAVTCQAP